MLVGFAAMLTMLFIGWIIFQALSGKSIKPYIVMYLLAVLTGIYTLAFFLSMELNLIVKVIVSIILGAILIFFATSLQRRLKSSE